MDREERLRRRREQYRVRRSRETAEEREQRLEARRVRERRQRAMISTEHRQMLLQQRREARHRIAENQPLEIPSVDDPFVVSKVTEFYNHLYGLSMVKCSICSEQFPNIQVNSAGSCKRCATDKHIPKLYSALNNMDPGAVPVELSVSI